MRLFKTYDEFITSKDYQFKSIGFDVNISDLHDTLFDWQKDVVKWDLKKGRAAVFASCGLGKSLMQLEWAKHVSHKKGNVLIVAPLAVANQTLNEAKKINLESIEYSRDGNYSSDIVITNYEMLHKFDSHKFDGIVLDESSILKNYSGKYRTFITSFATNIDFRLCCTATPSPNDYMELGTHCEFLGIMSRAEMLSTFFVHDSGDTSKWRLKKHAEDAFWKWVATWAIAVRKPSDLGYSDEGFILPDLNIKHIVVDKHKRGVANTLSERREARKESIDSKLIEIENLLSQIDPNESVLLWCDYNYESEAVKKHFGIQEIKGSDDYDSKERKLIEFTNGKIKRMVTKPSIAGFGLNWQHCNKIIYVGLSDSYEQFYQSVRRFWRFGQKREVDCWVITSHREKSIVENVKRKEEQSEKMYDGIIKYIMNDEHSIYSNEVEVKHIKDQSFEMYMGDSVELTKEIADESIDYSIFSPPFANLYTYTNSIRDIGNCRNYDEFFTHFSFLVKELYRVIKQGRLISFHCVDIPAMKERDGYIGLKDFPGDLLKVFQNEGFIYHSKHIIWKDPLVEATRTKSLGLLHKQIQKDSSRSRAGLPDYLITVRKPGENKDPITHENGFEYYAGDETEEPKIDGIEYSHHVWRKYANPVWMDIRQTDTLNFREAKDVKDERHICLAEGSLVLTKRGYVPIESIVVNEDYALTHMGNWKKIIAKQKTKEKAEVIQVFAQGVPNLIMTPNHKLWTRESYGWDRKENLVRTKPKWEKAENCIKKHYLNQKLPPVINCELSNKELWIIGRYLADGHIDSRKRQFFVSIGDKKYEEFEDIAGENIGLTCKHKGCVQIGLKKLSKECKAIMHKCGYKTANKNLPLEILSLNAEQAQIVLDGYVSGDGHISGNKIYCSSISRSLLLGISILFQRTGKVASIYKGRDAEWVLAVSKNYSFSKIMDDGCWKFTKKIEKVENRDVWNIRVEDDESYNAEGCIVKNCPLQLGVIERGLELWTKKGDLVFSPFAGVGSEGYMSILKNRRFVGIELKESYFDTAVKNLKTAQEKANSKENLELFMKKQAKKNMSDFFKKD